MGLPETSRTSMSFGFTTRVLSTEYSLDPTSVHDDDVVPPNLPQFAKEHISMAADVHIARFIRERSPGNVAGSQPQGTWPDSFRHDHGNGEPAESTSGRAGRHSCAKRRRDWGGGPVRIVPLSPLTRGWRDLSKRLRS